MEVKITTRNFNMHEFEALACAKYCRISENGPQIRIDIDDRCIADLITCLTMVFNKYDMLHQSNANMPNPGPIIPSRISQYMRIKNMISEVLSAISSHQNFNVDDLNK